MYSEKIPFGSLEPTSELFELQTDEKKIGHGCCRSNLNLTPNICFAAFLESGPVLVQKHHSTGTARDDGKDKKAWGYGAEGLCSCHSPDE